VLFYIIVYMYTPLLMCCCTKDVNIVNLAQLVICVQL
jgi:hypothetical protein